MKISLVQCDQCKATSDMESPNRFNESKGRGVGLYFHRLPETGPTGALSAMSSFDFCSEACALAFLTERAESRGTGQTKAA